MDPLPRLSEALAHAEGLLDAANEGGGFGLVDPDGFPTFRASVLRLLERAFGSEHSHTEQFFRTVVHPSRSELRSAVAILTEAVADLKAGVETADPSLEQLLHPTLKRQAYQLFREGHYESAVLEAMKAVFGIMRSRTGSDSDGTSLVNETFAKLQPRLLVNIFGESTDALETGRDVMMKLLQGATALLRNQAAHKRLAPLTRTRAAQYLIFASTLATLVDESRDMPSAAK